MKKKHFTLIELLVAIGIIAILSAILLPVLAGSAKKADMSKARSEISTLVNAIKQYESVYGVLPVPGLPSRPNYNWKVGGNQAHRALDDDAYRWLIKVLQAQELTSTEEDNYGELNVVNSRRQKFLDIVGNNPGEYYDPWDQPYKVFLDSDYDGMIRRRSNDRTDERFIEGVANLPDRSFPDPVGGNRDYVNFSVVVWSAGPDAKYAYPPSDKTNRDNIYSFPTQWSREDGHNISR